MLPVHTVETFSFQMGKEALTMTVGADIHNRDAPVAASPASS